MVHTEHEEDREEAPFYLPMGTNRFGQYVISIMSRGIRARIVDRHKGWAGHGPVEPSMGLKAHPFTSKSSVGPYGFNVIITHVFVIRAQHGKQMYEGPQKTIEAEPYAARVI